MEKTGITSTQGCDLQYTLLPCGNYNLRMREPSKAWTPYRRFKDAGQFKSWWENLPKLETVMQVKTAYESNVKKNGGCRG